MSSNKKDPSPNNDALKEIMIHYYKYRSCIKGTM